MIGYVPNYFDWTDERVEHLKKMHTDGLNYGRIARELGDGVTRKAVCGKIYRLGLSVPRGPYTKRPDRRGGHVRAVAIINKKSNPLPCETISENAPASLNLTCEELTETTCKWPTGGEGAETLFCGHKSSVGKPYCPFHVMLSGPNAQQLAMIKAWKKRGAGTMMEAAE